MGIFQTRATVALSRHTTYGLGGVEVVVRDDGRVSIRHEGFGETQRPERHEFTLDAESTRKLFAAFEEAKFATLTIPNHCGVPDELYFTLELRDGAGKAKKLGKFVQTPLAEFDRLVEFFHKTIADHLDKKTRERLTL
jgi:hypothetical protein